jgi:hypothetical protein
VHLALGGVALVAFGRYFLHSICRSNCDGCSLKLHHEAIARAFDDFAAMRGRDAAALSDSVLLLL